MTLATCRRWTTRLSSRRSSRPMSCTGSRGTRKKRRRKIEPSYMMTSSGVKNVTWSVSHAMMSPSVVLFGLNLGT